MIGVPREAKLWWPKWNRPGDLGWADFISWAFPSQDSQFPSYGARFFLRKKRRIGGADILE
jgi:hypothetical protein